MASAPALGIELGAPPARHLELCDAQTCAIELLDGEVDVEVDISGRLECEELVEPAHC